MGKLSAVDRLVLAALEQPHPTKELKAALDRLLKLTRESAKDSKLTIHAKFLGRKGGMIGGVARAGALSPERRSEIARKAAEARWNTRANTEAVTKSGEN